MGFTSFDGDILITNDGSKKFVVGDRTYEIGGNFSGTDIAAKVFGGFKFSEYLAAEIAFHRFGGGTIRVNKDTVDIYNAFYDPNITAEETESSLDVLGLSGSLLGIIPLTDTFDVFAKIGILHSWLSEDSFDETGFTLLLGGGASIKITENFSIRAELEWAPDIANDHSDKTERLFKGINKALQNEVPGAGKLDYDVDLDIISTTASLVWNF